VYVEQTRRTVDSSVGYPVPPTVTKAIEGSLDAGGGGGGGLLP
jgi:hypothetical protein